MKKLSPGTPAPRNSCPASAWPPAAAALLALDTLAFPCVTAPNAPLPVWFAWFCESWTWLDWFLTLDDDPQFLLAAAVLSAMAWMLRKSRILVLNTAISVYSVATVIVLDAEFVDSPVFLDVFAWLLWRVFLAPAPSKFATVALLSVPLPLPPFPPRGIFPRDLV